MLLVAWLSTDGSNRYLGALLPRLCEYLHVMPKFYRDEHFNKVKAWPEPAKSKRGREEGDRTENVINCCKLLQIVVTFHDGFYDDL